MTLPQERISAALIKIQGWNTILRWGTAKNFGLCKWGGFPHKVSSTQLHTNVPRETWTDLNTHFFYLLIYFDDSAISIVHYGHEIKAASVKSILESDLSIFESSVHRLDSGWSTASMGLNSSAAKGRPPQPSLCRLEKGILSRDTA